MSAFLLRNFFGSSFYHEDLPCLGMIWHAAVYGLLTESFFGSDLMFVI